MANNVFCECIVVSTGVENTGMYLMVFNVSLLAPIFLQTKFRHAIGSALFQSVISCFLHLVLFKHDMFNFSHNKFSRVMFYATLPGRLICCYIFDKVVYIYFKKIELLKAQETEFAKIIC